MAVEVHIASLALLHIDSGGNVYKREDASRSIKQNLDFSTEHRVIEDSANTNTNGHPDIKTYLEREAADDFEPVQVFQSMIITKKVT